MKKMYCFILVINFSIFTVLTYAHDHKPINDSKNLTITERQTDSLMQLEMIKHQEMEAVSAFPNYHPLIVHFPIVLLIMAALFQLLSFFFFKKELSWVTLILLVLGVITAWLSSNTFHAETGILSGKAKEIFSIHEQMASFTWWFSFAALLLKIISYFFLKQKLWVEGVVTLLLIAATISVSIAGHHGAMLVHMEGIGPMGKYLDSYHYTSKNMDTISQTNAKSGTENNKKEHNDVEQEMDHHLGDIGKGPHGGTIEEADPFHMEIVSEGNDLIFYLLDGDAKPLDMKNVSGNIKIQYNDKSNRVVDLMMMDGKLTAMKAINGKSFMAICKLIKDSKVYTASFNSTKDLHMFK